MWLDSIDDDVDDDKTVDSVFVNANIAEII